MIDPRQKQRIGALATGSLFAIMIFFGFTHGVYAYERTPLGSQIVSPVTISVDTSIDTIEASTTFFDSCDVGTGGSNPADIIGIILQDENGIFSRVELATTTYTPFIHSYNLIGTVDLPVGYFVAGGGTTDIELGCEDSTSPAPSLGDIASANLLDETGFTIIAGDVKFSTPHCVLDTTGECAVQVVDNLTQDIFNGVLVFFMSMFGVLWLFKRFKA